MTTGSSDLEGLLADSLVGVLLRTDWTRVTALRDRVVIVLVVNRLEQRVLPGGCSLLEQRPIGPRRAKSPLQVRCRGPIDAPVALDVVALRDRGGRVTEKGRCRVAPHASRDDRGT